MNKIKAEIRLEAICKCGAYLQFVPSENLIDREVGILIVDPCPYCTGKKERPFKITTSGVTEK
jgi:hypothetical protein